MANILIAFLEWIHILAVVTWVGGGIFFDMVLQPNLEALGSQQASQLNQAVAKKFSVFAWTATIIIAVTGLIMLYVFGLLNLEFFLETYPGQILAGKIIIFLITFIDGLALAGLSMQMTKSSDRGFILKSQRRIKFLSRTNIVLGVLIIFLAVLL